VNIAGVEIPVEIPVLAALIAGVFGLVSTIVNHVSASRMARAEQKSDQALAYYNNLATQNTAQATRIDNLVETLTRAQLDILDCLQNRNRLILEVAGLGAKLELHQTQIVALDSRVALVNPEQIADMATVQASALIAHADTVAAALTTQAGHAASALTTQAGFVAEALVKIAQDKADNGDH